MDNRIAYCGLNCTTCEILLATFEQDQSQQLAMRESIAELCTKKYGMNLKPADITDCDGCRANTGRLFSGCWNCEIRKCAFLKNIESCAFCKEYACTKLLEHFSHDPDAQNRLMKLREKN